MTSETDKKEVPEAGGGRFFFDEPRLGMTFFGRILARIAGYIGYLVLCAAAFAFVISRVTQLRALGALLALFLADRAMHWREADVPFSEMPSSGRVNLARYLSPSAYSILEKAFDRSLITKRNFFLETVKELLGKQELLDGLRRLEVKPEEFKQKLDELLTNSAQPKTDPSSNGPSPVPADKASLIRQASTLVLHAQARSLANSHRFIEPADLFSGIFFAGDEAANRLFGIFSIEADDLELAVLLSSLKKKFRGFRRPSALGGFTFESQRRVRHRIVNRAWTSRPTPTLDAFSSDLTDLARTGGAGFLIGHRDEYERLADTLARSVNPNALLVGEEGVGKETVVMHLASRLVKDEVPARLFDKRLVSLEIQSLIAGAAPEELQARLKRVVEELFMAGNVILYIPDFHNLVNTSGSHYLSAADGLMPVIKNNLFPIIGATYPREFKSSVEPRSDVMGMFEVIRVNEISEDEAKRVLIYDSILLESRTNVRISFGAVKAAVALAKKYLAGKYLPSSAEELLKDALAVAERKEEPYVRRDEVVEAAEKKTHVPIHEAGQEEAEGLLHLEDAIHTRMIDQEEAVKAIATALREYRSGLARKGGPIASFLFVGPTGVGKTELAKILARLQFGSEQMMIRFDMTEYQDKESFHRFIGSPDGATTGALTEAVLQKPYSLVLLDEFEKAFPDILNLFLQVFDDGRLTDNFGRTVNFQNTIIIATSNAHSDIINEAISKGEKMADIAEYLKKRLVDAFKPELLNRFTKIIVFKDLSPKDVAAIAVLNLKDLASTLDEQGIAIEFDESAVKEIARLGYDPAFGARPLRRAIEENLRAPLAEKLLAKEFGRGDKVKVSAGEGKFGFVKV